MPKRNESQDGIVNAWLKLKIGIVGSYQSNRLEVTSPDMEEGIEEISK
jgi:hypothetical protein